MTYKYLIFPNELDSGKQVKFFNGFQLSLKVNLLIAPYSEYLYAITANQTQAQRQFKIHVVLFELNLSLSSIP